MQNNLQRLKYLLDTATDVPCIREWAKGFEVEFLQKYDSYKKNYQSRLSCAHYNFSQLVEDALTIFEEILGI